METILTNRVATIRREQLSGRDYFVAPSTTIVPGVLNGSKGRLLYLPEHIGRNPDQWNAVPVTIGHPKDQTGKYTSARIPNVSGQYEIGRVYNTQFNGELVSEAWFDKELLERSKNHKAKIILNKLKNNEPIELSTGLFTTDVPVPKGSNYFGQPYDYIATNFRPDHLAVLVDERGACSRDDGCGIAVVNAEHPAVDDVPGDNHVDDPDVDDDDSDLDTDVYDAGEPVGNKSLIQKFIDLFSPTTNAAINQPKSLNTGKFKKPGSGTGKGPCHEAAQAGAYGPKPCECEVKTDCQCEKAPVEPTSNSIQEPNVDKKQAIAYLTANCACWKGEEKTLESFAENKLKQFVEADQAAKSDALVANAVREAIDDPDSDVELTDNELPAFIKKKMGKGKKDEKTENKFPLKKKSVEDDEEMEDEEDEEVMNKKKPTANEWLADAPPEIQGAVRNAMRIEEREKKSLVANLVKNVEDDKDRQRLSVNLMKKSIDELTDLTKLSPTANEESYDAPSIGTGSIRRSIRVPGGPTNNARGRQQFDKDDVLPLPTLNFSKPKANAAV